MFVVKFIVNHMNGQVYQYMFRVVCNTYFKKANFSYLVLLSISSFV